MGEPLTFQGVRLTRSLGRVNRPAVESLLNAYDSVWQECMSLQKQLAAAEAEVEKLRESGQRDPSRSEGFPGTEPPEALDSV